MFLSQHKNPLQMDSLQSQSVVDYSAECVRTSVGVCVCVCMWETVCVPLGLPLRGG